MSEDPGDPTAPFTPTFTGPIPAQADLPSESSPEHVTPELVPGSYQYLKRWMFALVVGAVWIVAAVIGMTLYHWWFQSIDKTWPVFLVMVYLVVCVVASLLLAMVADKPLRSAVSIALMSAPFASTVAAAVLHGAYVFQWFGQ